MRYEKDPETSSASYEMQMKRRLRIGRHPVLNLPKFTFGSIKVISHRRETWIQMRSVAKEKG